jgi:DNA-binding transcriptional regulator GbsR (MarR family)
MELITAESLTLDELVKKSNFSLSKVSVLLSQMEIKQLIQRTTFGTFAPR